MKSKSLLILAAIFGCSIAASQRQLPLNFTLRPRFVDAFSTGFVSENIITLVK